MGKMKVRFMRRECKGMAGKKKQTSKWVVKVAIMHLCQDEVVSRIRLLTEACSEEMRVHKSRSRSSAGVELNFYMITQSLSLSFEPFVPVLP